MSGVYDFVVVGGGAVGVATALALAESQTRPSVLVLEAETRLAAHQSGHNSGVIHSGLYYKPGSLKASTSTSGREALYRFCAENGVPHRRTGKLVVATQTAELAALDELERRGRANGLAELKRLDPEGLREIEPEVAGLAGLWVGETGIVDFVAVTAAYARRLVELGGEVRTGARLLAVTPRSDGLGLETSSGEVSCRRLVGCAGLASDRVARLCGVDPEVAIVPFRGDYYQLQAARRGLVRGLIYPVPDPALPFLGVHLTRTIHDQVEAGPNAVLALARQRYSRLAFSPRDAFETLAYPGTWRLLRRYWRTGWAELARSFSQRSFASALARLVPAIRPDDIEPAGCGIRAQAVGRDGRLVDDFLLVEGPRSLHVLNAPSPAATASLAIGKTVAARALAAADLKGQAGSARRT